MFELDGKVVVVVGGRGYLGRNFCQNLKKQNAHVISADLKIASKVVLNAKAESLPNEILQYDVDVTNKNSVTNLINDIITKFSKIDVLVYSVTAKPDDFYAPFTECTLDGWKSVINAELDGAFLITQQVGKVMEKQKQGSIIYISSIYGVVGNDQRIYEGSNLDSLYAKSNTDQKQIYSHSVYPVVKGGLISLTRYLAAYWGHLNIRVNCVSPGGIEHQGENDEFVIKYSAKVPLGRKANVNEVSGAIIYLASDESSYMTGQNMIVDGGWTCW